MKKFLSLVLVAVMLFGTIALTSCGEKDGKDDRITLNVYTNPGFAPYEYIDDNGKVAGIDIDVMNAIGEKLGYKVIINAIDFNEVLNEVQKDEFAVGASGMSKKPARDEVALSSDVYATSVQYVIAPVGAFEAGAVVTLEQLVAYATEQGKAIGDQTGTTGADMVAGAVEGTSASTMDYKNAIVASADIGSNVCSVVIDKMPAESICSGNDKLSCWQLDAEAESYVLYFNKNATELVAKVNTILNEMIEDGTIDAFTVKHSTGN